MENRFKAHSALRGALESGDVDLHHRLHRLEDTLRDRAIRVTEETRQRRRDDLPRRPCRRTPTR
jgi:hypothetical protein